MNDDALLAEYKLRYHTILQPLARKLTEHLQGSVAGLPRIDRVAARAKSPDRFMDKAQKVLASGMRKYAEPLSQIQDLVGARIIVLYLDDVEALSTVIDTYYRRVELRELVPESPNEFGYVGKHYILSFPEDLFEDDADRTRTPQFFELQVKTLFQHAWSEAEHDLRYKPEEPLTPLQSRQMAFTAAQAWGADQIFQVLSRELGVATSLHSNPDKDRGSMPGGPAIRTRPRQPL